jgi:hypothetical protein
MAKMVYCSESEDDLTAAQRSRLGHLMRGVLGALQENSDWPDRHNRTPWTVQTISRPHNVFCIDGGRGAGKTHLLLTVEYLLKAMLEDDGLGDKWTTTVNAARWSDLKRAIKPRVPIKSLRIIFPADLDKQEYVMEAVVAMLRADIDKGIAEAASDSDKKRGVDVRTMLIDEVATGHYFARRFGVDTVTRDSLNFKDMVKKWDDLNVKAAGRTESWRTFIEAYLDWRGIGMLAILLDDSDQRPEVTYDILQTARTMFSHPQIVTVIAGNTRLMRNSLLSLSMRELAGIMPALNKKEHPTGEAWRRAERRQVEQEIEKILPEAKRFYLPSMGATDFAKVAGISLNDLISDSLHNLRDRFMKVKMLKAFGLEVLGTDLPDPVETGLLEEYMSWWIFQTQFISKLRPFSARQARTFGEYFDTAAINAANDFDARLNERETVPGGPQPILAPRAPRRSHLKRLSVALFENSSNYALLQRVEDDDSHVIEWLSRQKLDSHWGDKRAFLINERRVEAGTYSYDFLTYRLDLGLALPLQENPDRLAPAELMPLMLGRKRMRPFYRPRSMPTRPRLLGLAGIMGHAAMPGNCLYFHQLSALPASSFVSDTKHVQRTSLATAGKGSEWEEQLYTFWPEILDRDQDEAVQDYLIDVFGRLRKPRSSNREGETTADLVVALRKQAGEQAGEGERAHYRTFLAVDLIRKADPSDPDDPIAPEHPLALALARATRARRSALFSDLRRSWHALRIWQQMRGGVPESDTYAATTHSLMNKIAASDRMELYTLDKLIETLRQDDWVAGALKIFGRLVPKREDYGEDGQNIANPPEAVGLHADGDEAKFFRLLDLDDTGRDDDDPNQVQKITPEDWADGWRHVGRKTCQYWPSHNTGKIVDDLFKDRDGRDYKRYRIHIFTTPDANATGGTNADAADKWEADKARSARAFIWLLYGLAPGLSAIIHADIVGFYRFARENGDNEQDATTAVRSRLRRWTNLIARLTAILRYLKYKCLTMYVVSTLTHLKHDYIADGAFVGEAAFEYEKFSKFVQNVTWRANRSDTERSHLPDAQPLLSREEIRAFFLKMYDHFVPEEIVKRESEDAPIDPLLRDLNIMPDASPSTLFGEKWLENLFVPALREQEKGAEKAVHGVYRGVSYEGVFGETERWLWAANEMTRCIWDEFPVLEAKPQASEPETPGPQVPAHPSEDKSAGSTPLTAEPVAPPRDVYAWPLDGGL